MSVRGSCLCGAVAYAFTGTPMGVFHCHCSRCRKTRGTAHGSNLLAPLDGFHFASGEDELVRFKPADAQRFTHVFCRTCGSSMPNADATRGIVIIPMGSLDDPPPACGSMHIYVGSSAAWEASLTPDVPRHDAGPPVLPFQR